MMMEMLVEQVHLAMTEIHLMPREPTAEAEQMLRVALVHWTFLPTTGGVESHLFELAHWLIKNGCRVCVITGELAPVQIAGCDMYSVPALNLGNFESVRDSINLEKRLLDEFETIMKFWQPDIVHCHNLHHFAHEPASAIAKLQVRCGFRFHHTFHEVREDLLASAFEFRNCEQLYAVSRFVGRACVDRLGLSARALHLGVDPSTFCATQKVSERPIDENCITILHPARLLPWKGVHLSIRMLAKLRGKGFRVRLVITDAPQIADWHRERMAYRDRLLQLINDLDIQDSVVLRPTAYNDMPSLYSEADLVVYPTIGDEPYGLVPLEAMSCERPVIVARSGGLSETVINARTGMIVPPNSVRALTEAASLILTSPKLACKMGAAGRRHVEEYFTIEKYGMALLRFYGVGE